MRFKPSPLLVLSLLIIGTCSVSASVPLNLDYDHEVIAYFGEDRIIVDVANFLVKKRETVVDSYLCKWNVVKGEFEYQDPADELNISEDDWIQHTRLQIVGNVNATAGTIDGLSTETVMKGLSKLTYTFGVKELNIVTCSQGVQQEQAYLKQFMIDQVKYAPTWVRPAFSIRSSLVSVDQSGRELTGEIVCQNADSKAPSAVLWSLKTSALKWVGKNAAEAKDIEIKGHPLSTGSDALETGRIGILHEGSPVYITEFVQISDIRNYAKTTYILTDDEVYSLLNEAATEVYKQCNVNVHAEEKTYDVYLAKTDGHDLSGTKYHNTATIPLREFKESSLLKEICYQISNYDQNGPSKDVVRYRFGAFVVTMSLENFHVKLEGIVSSYFSDSDLWAVQAYLWPDTKKIQNYATAHNNNYHELVRNMDSSQSGVFLDGVRNWINGRNDDINTTTVNFIPHAYNALCGAVIFLSSPIRNFHNHITNMLALDMIDANILSKERFFSAEVQPILAKNNTWLGNQVGVKYMQELATATSTDARDEYILLKSQLSCVTKSWLSYLAKGSSSSFLSGSRDFTPVSTLKTDPTAITEKAVSILKEKGADALISTQYLRKYEQSNLGRMLSTHLSEPEVKSVDTQIDEFTTTTNKIASLRTSLALGADLAYISKSITDATQKEVGKNFEIEPDTLQVFHDAQKGMSVKYAVYDKADPSPNPRYITAPIDKSKLSFGAVIENFHEEKDIKMSIHPAESALGKGMAAYGIVSGFNEALKDFDEGDTAHGVVAVAESLHGIAELTGVSKKIWSAAKGAMKGVYGKMVKKVSTSSVMKEGEEGIESEVSSVLGDAGDFMEDIPILGAIFGIYNIIEDFSQHTTIGYIDAGFDIMITGLSFAGPEMEPFIIALSAIKTGVTAWYTGITDELGKLPSDASAADKTGAVFKGILDGEIKLAEQFTIIGGIVLAVQQSNKLESEYQENMKFLSNFKDFHKFSKIETEKGSANKEINFIDGPSSLYGGAIQFTLGEHGQSVLNLFQFQVTPGGDDIIIVHKDQFTNSTYTINTNGVEDIVMGIGEGRSFQVKKFSSKFLGLISVKTRGLITSTTNLTGTLFGEYIGNSKDNRFYAVQDVGSLNLSYSLSDYNYVLRGMGGNDLFYLGPERVVVEGNEGSDTYYVTVHDTFIKINNFADDLKIDLLILPFDLDSISLQQMGSDVVVTGLLPMSKAHGGHITLKNWFESEYYQHMLLKTQDNFHCKIDLKAIDKIGNVGLFPSPQFYDASLVKNGQTVDAQNFSDIKVLIGSPYNDILSGNDLDNHINGNGGSDTLTGRNGRDIYITTNNTDTQSTTIVHINNYATDGMVDVVLICAQTRADVELLADGDDLLIRSRNCKSDIYIRKWSSGSEYQHLILVPLDGEVLTISWSLHHGLKCHSTMIDMAIISDQQGVVKTTFEPPDSSDQDYGFKKVVDLSNNPQINVTTVLGSSENDLIIGDKMNNYIAGGKGYDVLYGNGGQDHYVIKQGDGISVIFLPIDGDKIADVILFDAEYEDIKLLVNKLNHFVMQAHESTDKFLAVKINCMKKWNGKIGAQDYSMSGTFIDCFSHNSNFIVRSKDGIVFTLPTSGNAPLVKTPILVDYSNTSKGFNSASMKMKNTAIVRYTGSKVDDIIIGNSLNNYIDPGLGNNLMRGNDGSDTYVIRPNYCGVNTIDNYADDVKVDVLLFMVPFESISASFNGTSVELTASVTKGCQVVVALKDYVQDRKSHHLVVKSGDDVIFALPPNRNFIISPLFWNKARAKTGQSINATAEPDFLAVRAVYGANNFMNHIVGNEHNNTIVGGIKKDYLYGMGGDDLIKGGLGDDILDGGPGDDILDGGPGNNKLFGGDGDDSLSPGAGQSEVHGGNGIDTVIYTGAGGGVEVKLKEQVGFLNGIEVIITEVENAIGTVYSDTLEGDDQDNVLIGDSGHDRLYAGKSGYDILDGGNGTDLYSWFPPISLISPSINASVMIIRNYASDKAVDWVQIPYVQVKEELGFEKSGYDLVIRPIHLYHEHQVFYDNEFVLIFKDWFHPVNPALYRHVQISLHRDFLLPDVVESLGEDAAVREETIKNFKKG